LFSLAINLLKVLKPNHSAICMAEMNCNWQKVAGRKSLAESRWRKSIAIELKHQLVSFQPSTAK
jgi:hypothetical protein